MSGLPSGRTVSDAFYVEDRGRFVSTDLTRGPWDPGAQHGGPPAALLGRTVEHHDDRQDLQVARITFEILRPVPIAPLEVRTDAVRQGRSVQVVAATMTAHGVEVMRATALRIRKADLPLEGIVHAEAPPGPEQGTRGEFFATGQSTGYHTAMETSFLEGGFLDLGPAKVWMRMRCSLLAGEEPSPLVRVLVAADSGNGASATLDYGRFLFINPDLTVALHRLPVGEWVCLDARTTIEAHGLGLAESMIFDRQGPIGRGMQSLFVAER